MEHIKEKISNLPPKQLWFAIIFVFSSIIFWGSLLWSLVIGFHPWLFSFMLILGIFWTSIVALSFLFVDRKLLYVMHITLAVILLLMFGFDRLSVLGVVLFTLLTWVAHLRGERMRVILAEFKPFIISRKAMFIFFTGFAILLAFLYHNIVFANYYEDLTVSEEVYSTVFEPVEKTISIILPEYEPGITVEELQGVVANSFISKFFPDEFTEQRELERTEEVDFGLERDLLSQTVEEFTLNSINTTLQTTLAPYKEFLPLFFIIGLFFAFRFLLTPFMWISLGLMLLEIKILSLYNILTIKEVVVEKELLELS